jgi:hypothetical protein
VAHKGRGFDPPAEAHRGTHRVALPQQVVDLLMQHDGFSPGHTLAVGCFPHEYELWPWRSHARVIILFFSSSSEGVHSACPSFSVPAVSQAGTRSGHGRASVRAPSMRRLPLGLEIARLRRVRFLPRPGSGLTISAASLAAELLLVNSADRDLDRPQCPTVLVPGSSGFGLGLLLGNALCDQPPQGNNPALRQSEVCGGGGGFETVVC